MLINLHFLVFECFVNMEISSLSTVYDAITFFLVCHLSFGFAYSHFFIKFLVINIVNFVDIFHYCIWIMCIF